MEAKTVRRKRNGFSLVELLIVVGVVVLLVAVTLPGLKVAKERARRVVCLSNIHQFILGLQVYAESNKSRLPQAGMESTFEFLARKYDMLADNTGSEKVIFCPSLGRPFMEKKTGFSKTLTCGHDGNDNRENMYIGFNYLGGHLNAPWPLAGAATAQWSSARLTTCKATMPIITELNIWSVTNEKTVAPHGKRGPFRLAGDYMNTGLGGITSGQMGAAGGNIGYIDGSGHWKRIDETHIYRVSINDDVTEWFSTW